VCELQDKLNMLFSFIRTHLKQKTIVFLSSTKQVRFVYEAFRKMRPGVSVMHLIGKQKQATRIAIFTDFCQRRHAVLFATDIAARGLDFPAVDWVVQADAPEDVDTYIHRVGRTARYNASGHAMLLLVPSEEKAMVAQLAARKIPIEHTKINPAKIVSIQRQLEAFCSQSPDLKYLAQKVCDFISVCVVANSQEKKQSFVSYVRSVFLQRNKEVFDVTKLPLDAYAAAIGLPGAPSIKVVHAAKARSHAEGGSGSRPLTLDDISDSEEEDNNDDGGGGGGVKDAGKLKPKVRGGSGNSSNVFSFFFSFLQHVIPTKIQKMFNRTNNETYSEHRQKLIADSDDDEDDDESEDDEDDDDDDDEDDDEDDDDDEEDDDDEDEDAESDDDLLVIKKKAATDLDEDDHPGSVTSKLFPCLSSHLSPPETEHCVEKDADPADAQDEEAAAQDGRARPEDCL